MRLLLVEDDATLGPQLQAGLQRAGYATDIATDGIEAEIQGKLEPYDLVILDLGLPKRNGLEILANWRSAQVATPVIILTARGGWQDKVTGFNTGADDYISKPFQIEELLARVSAVLKRSTGNTVETLHTAHFKLNEQTQTVIFNHGEQCNLTNIEFRLLRYFMLHSGHILSKSLLTEHIYAYDEDKDSNVIEVYVNRLRQKIGSHLIQTRRGQGYVFGVAS
ncbi:response regulator transcription factor [Methylotenera sp.]|uniref:response regulator transcription factor n=1 Tax=Methylotenera sp. TaxID=2051956 RepID=UPI002735B22D|nr:response regulator transcription factor [Methylotenera sp.]MDP3212254.1 response regulator transcription factor [Methylotenera sp.]